MLLTLHTHGYSVVHYQKHSSKVTQRLIRACIANTRHDATLLCHLCAAKFSVFSETRVIIASRRTTIQSSWDAQKVGPSLPRPSPQLESLARLINFSSGKMNDGHMTRKHALQASAASCRRWLPLNQLKQATPNTTWSPTGLKCYLAGADSQHAVSHFRQAYRPRVTLIKRFFCINNSGHCKASATRSTTKYHELIWLCLQVTSQGTPCPPH
jgi:hypothetical protein